MRVKITDDESNVGGFISWYRLATSLFPSGGEIRPDERVARFEISERGIHFFVTNPKGGGK